MDGGGGGNAVLASKNLFMGVAAAAGVGCLAFYAWNRWWPCREEASSNDTKNRSYLPLKRRSSYGDMGQSQSIHFNGTFDGSDQVYAPVEGGGRAACDDWSITVNPHEEVESQQLIQSSGPKPTIENGNGVKSKEDQRRFKRVIFRSRTDENDEATSPRSSNGASPNVENRNLSISVVTSQPKSAQQGPIVLTNLRLADKLKGFSNEEYQNTLQGTLNRLYGSTKILTVEEAKCLTLLLQQKSSDTLLKTLTTTSNLAAFTINQDLLREQGAVDLLIDLLHDDSLTDSAQVMLVQCIGNMAVNQVNNQQLQCCVPRIIQHLLSITSSELQRVMCVQALTNLSVDAKANDTNIYAPILSVLYQRLWSHSGVNIPALRLLVNLSCTANMIPCMLAVEARVDLCQLISDVNATDDVLVRATTFLFYLASTVDTLGLDDEEIRTKTAELGIDFEKSTFYRLFRGDNLRRFRESIERFRRHDNEEVRQRTARISTHLKNVEEHSKKIDVDAE